MSSGSGAGVRPIGSAATISSPKAVKTQGSAKKKTKSATPKAAAAASSSSAAPRIDHLSAASSLDTAAAAASVALTAQAHASAFPLLNRPFNPDEDADEEIDEAELQKQMEEMMAEDSVPPRPLTLEIIRQRCLPRELVESGNQELISKNLFQLERIYLDGQSLSSIDDCFDLMSHSLTHIYLQRNALTSTQGFSSLRQLRFLTLAHNRIRAIEGLAGLASLQFLDVSHNLIELLDTGDADSDEDTCQLPESLVVFNCAGNPFTAEGDEYKEHVATVSPYLKSMDGERITNRMRRGWGLEADEDDAEDDAAIAAANAAAAVAARARAAKKGDGDEEAVEELSESDEEDDADGDDAADIAAYALRAEAEEMRKRSEQRTMLYDTTHGVSPATTQQDRQDALAEAARAAGGKQ